MKKGSLPNILGELARPLVHEYNNFLNTLLLEIALLERALPASQRGDLAAIKKNARNITQLTQQWQNWRRSEEKSEPVDFRSVLQTAVEAICLDSQAIAFPKGELGICTLPSSLESLLNLLFLGVSGSSPGTFITVLREPQSLHLVVYPYPFREPAENPDQDLFQPVGKNSGSLCLAAIKSLADRLQARTSAEKGADGLILKFEFPLALK